MSSIDYNKLELNKNYSHTRVKYLYGDGLIKEGHIASLTDTTVLGTSVEHSLSSHGKIIYDPVYIVDYLGDPGAAWISAHKILWFDNPTLNALFGKNK